MRLLTFERKCYCSIEWMNNDFVTSNDWLKNDDTLVAPLFFGLQFPNSFVDNRVQFFACQKHPIVILHAVFFSFPRHAFFFLNDLLIRVSFISQRPFVQIPHLHDCMEKMSSLFEYALLFVHSNNIKALMCLKIYILVYCIL